MKHSKSYGNSEMDMNIQKTMDMDMKHTKNYGKSPF